MPKRGPDPSAGQAVSGARYIVGGIAGLIAGGLVLFCEVWTIVPAPTLPLLALAVVVPELTPWGIAASLVAAAIAGFAARGWARDIGVYCAAFALGCALVPWCLLPATVAACEGEMRLALGGALASGSSSAAHAAPYDLRTALAGYGSGGSIRLRPDLPVLTRDGTRLGLDIYEPARAGQHPTIVIIYGGAWIFGSRADSGELAREFARLGYTAIAIDYRHAPAYVFPTQIDDVRDALRTIAVHAAAWNVDRQRVALLGRSAGAELALLAAYLPEPLRVRAAVAYYAPTDLGAGYAVPPQPDPANVRRILRAYLGGTPENRRPAYHAASPIDHVHAGLPPTLLIGGGRDELVRLAFAHELRAALRQHRVRVAALDLPWSNHAFDSIANGTGGQLARYYTRQFLAATL